MRPLTIPIRSIPEAWRTFWREPDARMLEAGARGEVTVARIRLGAIVLLAIIPLMAVVRYGGAPQDVAGLIVLGVALLAGIAALEVARKQPGWSRLRLLTGIFDVTLVSALLAIYLALDRPYLAVNSRVTFLVYFLAIAASALRYDARICVLVGSVAMLEYLAIVFLTVRGWDVHGPAFEAGGYGRFEWGAQINRMFLLAVSTPLSVAVVRRTQALLGEVQGAQERLAELSRRLIAAQEDERQHLARELHDELGQSMTALKLQLQALPQQGNESLKAGVGECLALVSDTMTKMRDLALALRPSLLDDLGLETAIRWHASRLAKSAGFAVTVSVTGDVGSLSPERKTASFRVAQEALTNVARHAGAKHVAIELAADDRELWLAVRDDGCGFDVAQARRADGARSIGVQGMRERVRLLGGDFRLASAPGQGTVVEIMLPLADQYARRASGEVVM